MVREGSLLSLALTFLAFISSFSWAATLRAAEALSSCRVGSGLALASSRLPPLTYLGYLRLGSLSMLRGSAV